MDALFAFAAALVSLRLSARLVQRARVRRSPELVAWGASLVAYAVAAAAVAAGAAGGWHDATFRVYYLCGGLLTAPLLGVGSLLRTGRRWAGPMALVYVGLATGVAVAEPLTRRVHGSGIPHAQDHLDILPARLLAIVGNSLGTLAVVVVALLTLRRRPVGNTLIVAGVATAGVGTGVSSLGAAATAALVAVAALLLYAGVVSGR